MYLHEQCLRTFSPPIMNGRGQYHATYFSKKKEWAFEIGVIPPNLNICRYEFHEHALCDVKKIRKGAVEQQDVGSFASIKIDCSILFLL